jgi:hypothetical protein
MRVTTPAAPKTGVVGGQAISLIHERTMSVSELNQIISAFVIVSGVLAAVIMAM